MSALGPRAPALGPRGAARRPASSLAARGAPRGGGFRPTSAPPTLAAPGVADGGGGEAAPPRDAPEEEAARAYPSAAALSDWLLHGSLQELGPGFGPARLAPEHRDALERAASRMVRAGAAR